MFAARSDCMYRACSYNLHSTNSRILTWVQYRLRHIFIWHLYVWLINGISKKWLHVLCVLVQLTLHWLSNLNLGLISIKTYLHSIIFFSYAVQCFTKFFDRVSWHLRCELRKHLKLISNQLIIKHFLFTE